MACEEWLREYRYTEENLEKVRRFKACADSIGCTRAQLALAWTQTQEGVSSVILGASRLEQLRENLQALAVTVDDDLGCEIDDLFPGAGE